MTALFCLIMGILGVALGLLGMYAYDWIYCWNYNRKTRALRAKNEAFLAGQRSMMGAYADIPTYRVVLATPDRPAPDPWMKMVRDDIEEIFEELEGRA